MSNLQELINKTIHDIQFNGCTLPESIIRMQFDNIVACAKLEQNIESNQRFLESIGTAFGNGGNDLPNVIGDMITEPEQVGRWYQCVEAINENWTTNKWYFCPTNKPYSEYAFIDNNGEANGVYPDNAKYFDLTNPQLNNPDLDYVNPITN